MSSLAQIRGLVAQFLAGSVEVKEFADRFDLLLEAAEDSADCDASNLAKQVELRIARFLDGYISEVSLRVQLNALFPPVSMAPIVYVQEAVIPSKSSASQSVPFVFSGALSPEFGTETQANQQLSLITV